MERGEKRPGKSPLYAVERGFRGEVGANAFHNAREFLPVRWPLLATG
jgi:hypothetical protein